MDVNAVGRRLGPVQQSWDSRDVMLYALSVGAGAADPLAELDLTTENSVGHPLQTLPTWAVVVGARLRGIYDELGDLDWSKVVHGAQSVTLHRPLPVEGRVMLTTTIAGIYDKGSAALVELAAEAVDEVSGEPVFGSVSTLFVKGAGGWGGERGPASPPGVPDRAPDQEVSLRTRADQALLYRLNGDRNPLHSDPAFAARAGFERPILHGLCTYGFTGRALVAVLAGGDAARLRSMSARFSRPVLPGDALTVQIWRTGDGAAAFRTLGPAGGPVLDGGTCTVA